VDAIFCVWKLDRGFSGALLFSMAGKITKQINTCKNVGKSKVSRGGSMFFSKNFIKKIKRNFIFSQYWIQGGTFNEVY
jgi:hypothetical protein